nr:G protein-coupled receptor [Proales similis]
MRSEYYCLHSNQVEPDFHELFIFTGYRPSNGSILGCLSSLFRLNNNEMLNFWTHFVPFVFFSVQLFQISLMVAERDSQVGMLEPIATYLKFVCLFLLISSLAHAFNCLSLSARNICFLADYLSITMYGLASALAYQSYILVKLPDYNFFRRFYILGATFLTTILHATSSYTRFIASNKYRLRLRALSFFIQYLIINTPIFIRLFILSSRDHLTENSLIEENLDSNAGKHLSVAIFDLGLINLKLDASIYFWLHLIFSLISLFFYASHAPERWHPGKYDIVGHSHQWFHLASSIASWLQFMALVHEIIQNDVKKLYPDENEIKFGHSCVFYSVYFNCALFSIFSYKAFVQARDSFQSKREK